MTLDEGYGTHQTSFRIRKSLRELVHKPRLHKSRRPINGLPALPAHDYNKEEYAYDVLYECQRGLLQFDPNPWCDADMRFTPMDVENYQLPDPTWEWGHSTISTVTSLFK
ncbi:uncharacterized protein EV154DRAFT_539171 [Mucor mucedo]|uniref:uncharacterized protein n=1 Tax=Mucor mucedo TaxID=29922 RepID=UPI002220CC4E|nr:uncharacterized protein EV154DRAFT_539171 [Mucor mucedo]KAI7888720.1 hypothetical protein EV154DRAFT_539171 [Mucor mucedo]